MMTPIHVRDAKLGDLPRLLEIYNFVVRTSPATFDVEEQTIEQRMAWFREHGPRYPLIVGELDCKVVGYCSISKYRERPAYSYTVESSIYVDGSCNGRGIGKNLMREILLRASELGYHAVIAGITSDNERSIRLHESLGFKQAGCLKQVGHKFGRWHDVINYELLL